MSASTRTQITATAVCIFAAAGVAIAAGVTHPGAAGAATAGGLPQGGEVVQLNPADFTVNITNPYFPMAPGNRWVYVEREPGHTSRVVMTVTDETKRIANGITARVVRDVVSEGKELVEVTDDWYAQDKDGNVWYLGEATTEYVNGKPATTKGSFEAGVDGAQAGVAMPAKPVQGLSYRQEFSRGQAEDSAVVLAVREQAQVPFGHFRNVLVTKDLNGLKLKFVEYKLYARGVGPVMTLGISGTRVREELIRFSKRQ